MKISIAAAGAAMFAGLIVGTPAWSACLPLWGTVCRPEGTPAAGTTATTPEAKPQKPLNLRKVASKGGKRTRVAAHRHQPTVERQASRKVVTVRTRHASARRFAFAKRPRNVEARREEAAKDIPKSTTFADQAAQVAAAVATTLPSTATSNPPQTNGYVPSQNEVTELDLAADQPYVTPPVPPNPALMNSVTPGEVPANSNSASDQPADGAKPVTTNTPVAFAETPRPPEVSSSPTQQPADEPSWLRRFMIGLGGVLTLASAVRLFAG